MKIGFFDSGLGGLSIVKAVAKRMPAYDYVFYGDTAHLPFGDKSEADIYSYTKAGIEYLFRAKCQLVVIACNTASAESLRRIQDEFLPTCHRDRKVLGVIIPVIEEVIESNRRSIKLLATKRTVSSGKYHLELGKRNVTYPKIEAIALPELVPLIEEGRLSEAIQVITQTIGTPPHGVGETDGVILGCTHYSLLTDALRAYYGDTVQFFSQAEIIPVKLETYLARHGEIASQLSKNATRSIYLTERRAGYDSYVEELLSSS